MLRKALCLFLAAGLLLVGSSTLYVCYTSFGFLKHGLTHHKTLFLDSWRGAGSEIQILGRLGAATLIGLTFACLARGGWRLVGSLSASQRDET